MGHDLERSPSTITYSIPASEFGGSYAERNDAEDALRFDAFQLFHRSAPPDLNPAMRFARALVWSAGPIKDLDLLAQRRAAAHGDTP